MAENIAVIPGAGVEFHAAHTARSISRRRAPRKAENIDGIPSIIPIVFPLITGKLNIDRACA